VVDAAPAGPPAAGRSDTVVGVDAEGRMIACRRAGSSGECPQSVASLCDPACEDRCVIPAPGEGAQPRKADEPAARHRRPTQRLTGRRNARRRDRASGWFSVSGTGRPGESGDGDE
jgi:hypothetical protein